jgi:hypothetical protein
MWQGIDDEGNDLWRHIWRQIHFCHCCSPRLLGASGRQRCSSFVVGVTYYLIHCSYNAIARNSIPDLTVSDGVCVSVLSMVAAFVSPIVFYSNPREKRTRTFSSVFPQSLSFDYQQRVCVCVCVPQREREVSCRSLPDLVGKGRERKKSTDRRFGSFRGSDVQHSGAAQSRAWQWHCRRRCCGRSAPCPPRHHKKFSLMRHSSHATSKLSFLVFRSLRFFLSLN